MKNKSLNIVRNALIFSLLVDLGVIGFAIGQEVTSSAPEPEHPNGEDGIQLLLGLAGRIIIALSNTPVPTLYALTLRVTFVVVYSCVLHYVDSSVASPSKGRRRRGIYILTALAMSAWWRAGVLLAPGGAFQFAAYPVSLWMFVAIYATVRSIVVAVALSIALALILTGRRMGLGPQDESVPDIVAGRTVRRAPSTDTEESAGSTV